MTDVFTGDSSFPALDEIESVSRKPLATNGSTTVVQDLSDR
jgi:hypothetical protein